MSTAGEGITSADGWQAGMNLLSLGKAEEAVQSLRTFLQAHPNSFEGHSQLGAAYEKLGQKKSAQRAYQSALQIDPSHSGVRLALARLDGSTPDAATIAAPSTPPSVESAVVEQSGATPIAGREHAAKPNVLNVLCGFVAGVFAAIICAVLWDKLSYYTGWQFGYAAVGVGFLVGTAVVHGAGRKYGVSLQIIAALLSLGGILLGETLLAMDYVRDEIATNPSPATNGATSIEIFLFSAFLLPEIFKDSPMSAFFALLGLWCGWSAPATPKEEVEYPEATATDAPAPVAAIVDAPPATPVSTPSATTLGDAPPRA